MAKKAETASTDASNPSSQPNSSSKGKKKETDVHNDQLFVNKNEASHYRIEKCVIIIAVVFASIIVSAFGFVGFQLIGNVQLNNSVWPIPERDSVEDISKFLNSKFVFPRDSMQFTWYGQSEDNLLVRDETGAVQKVSLNGNTLKYTTFITSKVLKETKFMPMLNTKGDYMAQIVDFNKGPTYRPNFKVMIQKVDGTGTPTYVSGRGKLTEKEAHAERTNLQHFEWSPYHENAFAFVYAGKLFYVPDQINNEKPTYVVFESEKMREFTEAIPSWIYAEEVLKEIPSSIVWLPDSLGFGVYDINVQEKIYNLLRQQIPFYSNVTIVSEDQIYPEIGQQMTRSQFICSKIGSSGIKFEGDPNDMRISDQIMIGISTANSFIVFWFDVYNSSLKLLTTCADLKLTYTNIEHLPHWEEPSKYVQKWRMPSTLPLFVRRRTKSFDLDGLCTLEKGKHNIMCLQFPYEIDEVIGHSKGATFVYSNYGRMGERHLLAVTADLTSKSIMDMNKKSANATVLCMTCLLGTECLHSSTIVSPHGDQLILRCEATYREVVPYLIFTNNLKKAYPLNVTRSTTKQVEEALRKDNIQLPNLKFDTVNMSNGMVAQVRIILPPDFDETVDNSYPVLLNAFDGPGKVKVMNNTPSQLESYMVGMRNFVVLNIDARGSGGRGWKLRGAIHKNMSGPEVDDQIEVLKILLDRHFFMDRDRVGILGLSYGGFVALHFANRDRGDTAKCAVAISPLTNLAKYDAVFSGRYMGEIGPHYERANLINETKVEVFRRNVSLMLVHSISDDRVHVHHTLLFSDLLFAKNIPFVQLIYANQGHDMGGRFVNILYSIGNFLENCFDAI